MGIAVLGLALGAGLSASPAGDAASGDDPLRWLADYVRFDTTNPPGNEATAVRYLARILHRHGISTRTFYTADGRASLYARLEGRRDDGGLLLVHHVDVVAPGEGWSREPFTGEVVDGELWGRGAIDVKSLGIAHLAAFLAVADADQPPERDVAFLAVADEESGGGQGTAWLLENHPELFEGLGAALNEGGNNKVVNGRLLWWGVETAQKRPMWLRLTARGRAGHASGWNPGNATHLLVQGLDRMLDMPRQWRVSDPVRRYLQALAPLHDGATRRHFADPDAWIGPDGPREPPIMPGQANLFLDGLQVTRLDAGERINVVPPTATAWVDARLLPDTDADQFLAELRDALGPRIEVEVLLTSPPTAPAPLDHPLYRAVRDTFAAVDPGTGSAAAAVVPSFISGFTDSRYLRAHGLATYGVSPFLVEPDLLRGIHGPDERIDVADFRAGVERMTEIVERYAGRP